MRYPEPPGVRSVEVGPRAVALVQPDGGWCLNNVGLWWGEQVLCVVDTMATQDRNLWLREIVRARRGRRRVVVVNTHFHGDHTFGNAILRTEGLVVSTSGTARDVVASGLALCGIWPDSEWGEIDVQAADLSFDRSLTLRDGEEVLHLVEVRDAHTASDCYAWDPARRVLFTGDLVMNEVTPFFLMGSADGTLAAVRELRALDPRVVVPGHGPVGGPEILDRTEAYVRWCVETAERGMAAGIPPLQAARTADLGRYAGAADPERLVGNLHNVYARAAGHGPDPAVALREMAQFGAGAMTNRV